MRPAPPRRVPAHRFVVSGLAFALALAGCGPSAEASPSPPVPASTPSGLALHWPAPSNPLALTVEAGLVPEPKEHLALHSHAHLDVFLDGKPIVVPAGIGINIADPAVKHFDDPVSYGGIELCAQPCISPLHTHGEDGILHTESASQEPNTLGQFFIEWDVALSETCVGEFCGPEPLAFYVNGEVYTGDPSAIELTDLKEIAIVIGTPPAVIPSTADFSGA